MVLPVFALRIVNLQRIIALARVSNTGANAGPPMAAVPFVANSCLRTLPLSSISCSAKSTRTLAFVGPAVHLTTGRHSPAEGLPRDVMWNATALLLHTKRSLSPSI